MKIGVNLWVWVSPFRTDQDLHLIEKAKSMGAEVVEFAIEDGGVIDAPVLRRELADNQVECSVVGIFGPQGDFSSEDAAARRWGLDYAKRCVDLTVEGGATLFTGAVIGVGGKKRLSGEERRTRLGFASEALQQIGEYSAEAGIRFCVEILNRYESNLLTTAQEAHELINLVDHPAVGVHLDCFHMSIEETNLGAAIRLVGDKLFHLHTSASHRGTPGEGHVRWDEVAQALKDINYRGYGVIESFHPKGRLAPMVHSWRSFVESQDDLARNGLAFLNSVLPVG